MAATITIEDCLVVMKTNNTFRLMCENVAMKRHIAEMEVAGTDDDKSKPAKKPDA